MADHYVENVEQKKVVAALAFCAEHGHFYEKVPDALQREDHALSLIHI